MTRKSADGTTSDMTEIVHQAIGYRITFETFNDFFGAWLKRNFFTRRRLVIALVLSIGLMVATAVVSWKMYAELLILPNTPLWPNILIAGVMIVVALLLYFVLAIIPVYIFSPILSYLWLVVTFAIGPVRKRVNSAEISQQGISKSYEQHNHITPWNVVYDLVETKKSFLIFTNRNCAMMIPKAGFASSEQAKAFWSTAQNYWQQARTNTPPIS
ncbi:MAG: YcxB family protein [Asticcacaulis sp.]|nr:YcxB family protein [Asticcacaulis sp.]